MQYAKAHQVLSSSKAQQRILVIDDDPSIRRPLQIALSKAGYQVIESGDGHEAMRLWREQGVDLVITDIHMPDKDGLEVIRELRKLSPSTPIIAMTDGGMSKHMELLQDAKAFGALQTIAKPFRLEEMLAVVNQELKP
jgi:DNA-binding response OmpR family regulator